MIAIDEREALAELAREALARRSFGDYCARMDPSYVSTRHTRAMVAHLEALCEREIQKLMLFVPPRHGKTYHASERFPAYFLGRRKGRADVILASYTINRARKSSKKVRGLVRASASPFHDLALATDSQAMDEWQTSEGGTVTASGVAGSTTGFGADLLDIDDPIKNRKEANSPTRRQDNWEWYQDVAKTRLQGNSVELLMMTRWHDDDLAGRILNSAGASKWTVLRLPALAEADDVLGRAEGEELWPEAEGGPPIPRPDLGEISSWSFQALYQGDPKAREGLLFKRTWFRDATLVGDMLRLHHPIAGQVDRVIKLGACHRIIMVDLAASLATTADYFVAETFAITPPPYDIVLLDVVRGRFTADQQLEELRAAHRKWNASRIGIEDIAYQRAFVQLAQQAGLPAVGVKVTSNKEARAMVAAARAEAGGVYLIKGAPWRDAFETEVLGFPAAEHDDQVDPLSMCSQVVSELSMSPAQGIRIG